MCAPADTRPAIAAIKAGDMAGLDMWLATGADPDAHDAEGWTPLLWAAARGRADMVSRLLAAGAGVAVAHARSGALPVHMAGHSGDMATASVLLDLAPDQIDAVWDLNGHTILLQAVFYGHRPLARMLVERGADTSITTARGLGAVEFARQFQDGGMEAILLPHDSPAEAKAAYYRRYLARIAPTVPPGEAGAQALADRLVDTIQNGLAAAMTDPAAAETTMAAVRDLVETEGADVNRLGGPLGQPPLIVAVTGNNGLPPVEAVARLRRSVAFYLLERGADPTLHENHPMGAQTVIRAAVFNHLDILRACGDHLDARTLADAINEIPVVNGLTALHDTVLRATMAAPDHFEGYLAQAVWFMEHGGRSDIEDFAGVTQTEIARRCEEPEVRRRLLAVLAPGFAVESSGLALAH
jgi:ankyrin repeat protein